jgi:galactokinase/mevalonate kinase-like predicted kinase
METLHWLEVLTLERDVYSEASKIPQEVLENQVVIPWYMQPCAEGTISVDQESPSDIADERNDDDFSEENSTHSSSWKSKRRLDRKVSNEYIQVMPHLSIILMQSIQISNNY